MAALVAAWLVLNLGGSQVIELAGRTARVTCDHLDARRDEARIYLNGQATLAIDELTFSADQIIIDLSLADQPAIIADGRVTLIGRGGETLTAAHAAYDLAAERGEFEAIQVDIPIDYRPPLSALAAPDERPERFRLTAERATRDGPRLSLLDSGVTASRYEPPLYQIRSSRLDVLLGEGALSEEVARVTVYNGRLQLYGRTIIGLPHLTIGHRAVLLPTVGSNRTDGLFVEHPFAIGGIPNTRLTITPKLGTESLLTGTARFATGSPLGTIELLASYKERHVLEVANLDVVYSRLPEFGYIAPPVDLPGVGGRLQGYLSYGLFHEFDNLTTGRWQARAVYTNLMHAGDTSTAAIELGGRYTGYHTRQHYGVLWAGLTLEKQLPYWLYTRLGVRSHLLTGGTPMRFDLIEIPTSLDAGLRFRPTGHWLVGTDLRFDVNNQVLRRWGVNLAYRDRELEYGAGVVLRPGFEMSLDARLVGF